MPEELVPFEDCPRCRAALEVLERQVGGTVECPDCGEHFTARAVAYRQAAETPQPVARRRPVAYDEPPRVRDVGGKKLAAGLCAILLGWLGVHKFILGYTTAGVIMLLASLVTCFAAAPVVGIIGLVEGIVYLVKSDEEFYDRYVARSTPWF